MSFTKILQAAVVVLVVMGGATHAFAEQYRYQDQEGRFVVSSERPDVGVSYAVLDDEGVYLYLVHAAAMLEPVVDWHPASAVLDQDFGYGFADVEIAEPQARD